MADVGIAGAGLAGPLLAVYLSRRGHDVTMYERRPDPRRRAPPGDRSTSPSRRGGIDALRARRPRRGGARPRVGDGRPDGPRPRRRAGVPGLQRRPLQGDPLDLPPRAQRRAARRGGEGAGGGRPLRAAGGRRGGRHRRARAGRRRWPPLGRPRRRRRGRRRVQRAARGDRPQRARRLPPGAPAVGVQGADDRARPVGRLRPRSRSAAHLAARRLDDDRPAQPRPQLHRHIVLAVRRPGGVRRARRPGGGGRPLRPRLSRRHRAVRGPRR